MKRASILILLSLASCAELISVRGTEPTGEWSSSKSLDDTAACIVAAMDRADPRVNNSIQIKVPNKSYEISAPMASAAMGAEVYYVSLYAEGSRTRVRLFSRGYSTVQMGPAVAHCAS